jgi:hypothetical protein
MAATHPPVLSACVRAGLGLTACLVVLVGLVRSEDGKQAVPKFTAAEVQFYQKQVLPILQANCFKCHTGKKVRGGLRLDSRAAIMAGGDSGPAIKMPLEASPLIKAINFRDGLEMPPKGKLSHSHIEILTKWARMGLPFPEGKEEVVKAAPAHKSMKVTEEDRNWWAYRPVRAVAPPVVRNTAWVSNPIDHFILAKLEAKGLSPAAPAGRMALVRRVYYDLTGLPPSPAEIDGFIKDARPDAYERLVDRLLASPAYGEKWGRHWLDLVRFAETHGYERDSAKPFAWRYRDYVIDSFNEDVPYDQFLREQLAGDEMEKVTPRSLIATGYYRLGLWDDEPADPAQARYDILDSIVSTTGQLVLGMSIGCARCHDHKKDPVPQRDYYRLLAFFHDITPMNRENLRRITTPDDQRHLAEEIRAKQEREGKLYQQIYRLEQQFLAALASKKGFDRSRLVGSDIVDLAYRFYRDTWEKLPDFDAIKPEDTGKAAGNRFSLAPASRQEAIGLVFEGKLKVPQKGEYTFHLESTDGARLLVNGKSVIDRPNRGRQRGAGKASLVAGLVPIRLEYFNTYAQPHLSVAWEGPGVKRRPLSDEGGSAGQVILPDARRSPTLWRYTTTTPERGWMKPAFDDAGWKTGPAGFGTRGTPGTVVRTTWNTADIWLRKSFTVDRIPGSLALDLHHDDDVEVYLNGRPILRSRGFLTAYRRIDLPAFAVRLLRKGTNTLAVHCMQTTGGQYIDVGLVADARVDLSSLVRTHGEELLGGETLRRYQALKSELSRSHRVQPQAGMPVMCVQERGTTPTRLLVRGNPHAPGDTVTPSVPEVLTPSSSPRPRFGGEGQGVRGQSSGKRRALASWLTDPQNPLTARVMVNRLWQFHFGRGIVPTPSDFGKLGELPTHPELLDYLAGEFVCGGWKIKRLHRLILLSSTYRMSSRGNPEALLKDPANTLFWRFNMRRLTAEEVRDSMLAVSGRLNRRMSGPGIYPTIPHEVLQGQSMPGSGWGQSSPEEQARRSVYIHVKRSLVVPILQNHDLADTDASCAVRYTTTVPTQALGMLNGDFTNAQARDLAARLSSEASGALEAQVRLAIRLSTGRVPPADEVKRDVAFIKELTAEGDLDAKAALAAYCLLLLNTNEFMYLD